MTTLTGKTIANTYKDLLQVSNSNSGVDATLRSIEDGEGTSSALQVSTTDVAVQGDFSVSGQITVGGEVIAVDQRVSTSDALITENFGEVGVGVTNVYSGIEIDRGSANPYRFQFNETSDDFRIGEFYVTLTYGTLAGGTFTFNNKLVGGTSGAIGYIITDNGSTTATVKSVVGTFQNGETITEYNRSTGVATGVTASLTAGPAITDSTQAVGTREDTPTDNGVAFWDAATSKFETSSSLSFDGSALASNAIISITSIRSNSFAAPTTQGAYFAWNRGVTGETAFYNQKGLGSGGWEWVGYDNSNSLEGVAMTLGQTGGLIATSFAAASSSADAGMFIDSGVGGTVGNQNSFLDFRHNGTTTANMFIVEGSNLLNINSGVAANISMCGGGGDVFIENNATIRDGLEVGTPTGGNKGTGTINVAADIYKNNSAYTNPDYVLELWATGEIKDHAHKSGAEGYTLPTLEEVEKNMRESFQLPRMTNESKGVFGRQDFLLEKMEEAFIFIIDIQKQLNRLKNESSI